MSEDNRSDIWRLQAQFNTQGLEDALRSTDAGIRRRAAAALRALGAVDAIPALEKALETESDQTVRSNILAALAILQQEQEKRLRETGEAPEIEEPLTEHDRLVKALRYGIPDEAIAAANALGDSDDKDAVVPLVMMFNDPSTPIKVRLAVAEALLKLESAPVEVALLGALRGDEARVRRNAAAILGQLRATWAVEPLSIALDDSVELVSKTAHAALRFIGTPEAFEALRIHADRVAEQERLRREQAQNQPHPEPSDAADEDDSDPDQDDEATPSIIIKIGGDDDDPDLDLPDMSGGKIMWPRREREEKVNPMLAPTRPLDPKTLEILEKRLQKKSQTDESKSVANPADNEGESDAPASESDTSSTPE